MGCGKKKGFYSTQAKHDLPEMKEER